MRRQPSPLMTVWGSLLQRVRGSIGGRGTQGGAPPVQTFDIDLVGNGKGPTFGASPNHKPEERHDTGGSGSGALTHSFGSNLAGGRSSLTRAWSFNQTVLLTPKRRSSSLLVWTAVGAVGAVGIWAFAAPLAETIAVQGKLEPGSSIKRIDTPVPGVVETVLVKEGQRVRQGDPLVRFDLREPRSKLAAAGDVRRRLINENQIAAYTLGDSDAIGDLSANQRRQLVSQAEELSSRRNAAHEELSKARSSLVGARSNVDTYRNIANRYSRLVAEGAASEVQLLETRQRLQDAETQVAEDSRDVARLEANLLNTGASSDLELRRKIEENLRQISQIDADIRLARQQIQYGELRAPVEGIIFDLDVSPGSVVAQGTAYGSSGTKPLLKIVPQDALQARVFIPNSAVGFVRQGLKADISVDAFRASDFGYLPAHVIRIGSDALTADEQARELGTDAQGLYYPAVLHLERQSIDLRRKQVPLQAGMTVTADLKLRERRMISILTSFMEDQRRNLERLR